MPCITVCDVGTHADLLSQLDRWPRVYQHVARCDNRGSTKLPLAKLTEARKVFAQVKTLKGLRLAFNIE